jgi:hypothetical protein
LAAANGLYEFLIPPRIHSEWTLTTGKIARSVANQNGFPGHMGAPLTLIHELESSISQSSDERRSAMLRHLTDLFLVGSDQYSDAEIDLIDDVFVRLVATIEDSSRARVR